MSYNSFKAMKIKQISKFRKVNLDDFEEFKFSEIADYVNSTGLYEIDNKGMTAVVYITENKKYFLKNRFFKKEELPVYTFLQKIDDRWLNNKALELKAKRRIVKRCIYPQYMFDLNYPVFNEGLFNIKSKIDIFNTSHQPTKRLLVDKLKGNRTRYKIHLP